MTEPFEKIDEVVAVALKELDSLEAYVKTHERIDHQTQVGLLKWLDEIKEDVRKATK